jgi:hypothetical protein
MVLRYDDTNKVKRSIGLITINFIIYTRIQKRREILIPVNSKSSKTLWFFKRYFLLVWNRIPYNAPKKMVNSIE